MRMKCCEASMKDLQMTFLTQTKECWTQTKGMLDPKCSKGWIADLYHILSPEVYSTKEVLLVYVRFPRQQNLAVCSLWNLLL